MSFRAAVKRLLPKHRRLKWLSSLPAGTRLLDVGCGNHSATLVKRSNPGVLYHGIDIEGSWYEIDAEDEQAAEELVLVAPGKFVDGLLHFGTGRFDAILANHVLEHVDDRDGTMRALAEVLKPGGQIYCAFPNKETVNFPGPREGSLNYRDDASHRGSPPDVAHVVAVCEGAGLRLIEKHDPYQPFVRRVVGWAQEPISRRKGRTLWGTWEYYGFETILMLEKPRAMQ